MIDSEGYRANVGIILSNNDGQVFWARRIGQDAWQFPQGGIDNSETPEQAMYRELKEETGLEPHDVKLLGCTRRWLKYRLPMLGDEKAVDLANSETPEFDRWQWVDYWEPSRKVIFFKRKVYKLALKELEPLLISNA